MQSKDADCISIHAPARGATRSRHRRVLHRKFQSTLPRGERPVCFVQGNEAVYFNPRSREGSDLKVERGVRILIISIHAPARGATQLKMFAGLFAGISIHAPARGATAISSTILSGVSIFQSTLPRGERRWMRCIPLKSLVFQSTLPRGERRSNLDGFKKYLQISIHAPARGATKQG